jgi:DNA-binding XRE family transcriptional regulator
MTGQELRQMRRERDVTQATLGASLGVTRARVAHIEGQARVTVKAAAAYLAALEHVDPTAKRTEIATAELLASVGVRRA